MENSILKLSGSMDVKITLTSVLNKVIWFSADKWKDASFAFSSNASNAAQGVKLHHFGDPLSLMDPIVSLLCNCNYYYIICKLRPSIFLTIVLSYDRNRDVLLKVQIFWKGHKNFSHLPLFIWHYLAASNYKWKMGQTFVAFSEYLNFTSHNFHYK